MRKFLIFLAGLAAASLQAKTGNEVVLRIEPGPDNPRNSEGAFATLRSGRIIFYYTQFYGGSSDFSPARIAAIFSDDRGRTWSRPRVVISNTAGRNVMSVSLLRLADGRLALFHGIKNSAWDNHPVVRTSADEGASWSAPTWVVVAPGYYSRNNDRVVQLRGGRLIYPVSFDRPTGGAANVPKAMDERGIIIWYLSDDAGASWREADTWWALPAASHCGLQEPGVVELADGTLLSWARTDRGEQYYFRSRDAGRTWTPPAPSPLKSPCSPASIKRLPGSPALLAVFNDHTGRFPLPADPTTRTPQVAALSFDGGETWPVRKLLDDDPAGRYCYTAIHFVDDSVLLAYSAGDAQTPGSRWGRLQIRRIALSWLRSP